MIKLVIFDFDDTLEDYTSAYRRAERKFVARILEKYDVPKRKFQKALHREDRKFVHLGKTTFSPKYLDRHLWLLLLFEQFGCRLTKHELDSAVDLYWKLIREEAELFTGAVPLLSSLSKKYHLAILSDSDGERKIKMDRIRRFKIDKYFALIVTSDDTGKNKPALSNYDFILKKFGVFPHECVMVGDKPEIDLAPAKRLGLHTVWVKRGWWASLRLFNRYAYVDYSIKELRALSNIIDKIENKIRNNEK